MGYIYKITNTVTNKMYIGQTCKDINTRWRNHISSIKNERGCPALRDAIKKHGFDKFEFKLLLICFDDCIYDIERYYIAKFNTRVPNGYNISPGGMGGGFTGLQHTEETKKIIGEKSRQRYIDNPELREENSKRVKEAMKGLNISERMNKSEKWRQYVAKLRDGSISSRVTLDEETKAKISESLKKYHENKEGGTAWTEDNKVKHQRIMTEKKGKAITQLTMEDEVLATYPSISEAQRQTGIDNRHIGHALKGRTKSAAGYKWRYA